MMTGPLLALMQNGCLKFYTWGFKFIHNIHICFPIISSNELNEQFDQIQMYFFLKLNRNQTQFENEIVSGNVQNFQNGTSTYDFCQTQKNLISEISD